MKYLFGYKRQVVAQHQRALLLENGVLKRILTAGVYRWFDPAGTINVVLCDLTELEFKHPLADVFMREQAELCQTHFHQVEVGEQEVALLYANERLLSVLPPGSRRLYWKGPIEIRVQRLDIAQDFALEPKLAAYLLQSRRQDLWQEVSACIYEEEVPDHHLGLLIVNGKLMAKLTPGLHAFWRFNRNLLVELVDLRLQALEVQGQEILTKDKVSLRLNLTANYRVLDPVKARAGLNRYKEYLYRELQFGLRQAVAVRTLDELLGRKGELEDEMQAWVSERIEAHGLSLHDLGVKDVILPGDMKELLNQVVAAEKSAQANLIRRREETAATRSLLNTAKLMERNPVLLRLKELEALEKVTDKVGQLTVFGGLEGVLQGLVRIEGSAS